MKKLLIPLCLFLGTALPINAGNATRPNVRVDDQNITHGAWLYSADNDANYVVQAGVLSGGQWTTTTLSGAVDVTAFLTLAVNSAGDTVVTWIGVNSATQNFTLYVATCPILTGTWSSAIPLNTDGGALAPQSLSINTNGEIAVMWNAYTDAAFSNIGTYVCIGNVSTGTWGSVNSLTN